MNANHLLIIFYKNPVPGKVKTRIAADLGDEKALKIYLKLCRQIKEITSGLSFDRVVFYSSEIENEDLWDDPIYMKQVQSKGDIGIRMEKAFQKGFDMGYQKICLIGTDIHNLSKNVLTTAFASLQDFDATIGPAKDGGYYLIGMKKPLDIFRNKSWSHSEVRNETIQDLKALGCSYFLLKELNDIDTVADVKNTGLSDV